MRFTWALVDKGADTDRLAHLVADRIWPGRGKGFGVCRGIAILDADRLAAGLIYHNYDEDAGVVEISGGSWVKGWLTPAVLKVMYGYPFESVGCQAVVQRVSDNDKAQHRMLTAFGAQHHRLPRLRGRDEAENLFVTTDDVWKANNLRRLARERAELRKRTTDEQKPA